jgi:hypothetical protein
MINIDIKIKTSNKMLTKKKMQVKVTDGLTTLDVKNQIKSTISLPSEIISEEFYFGTGKMTDTDVVPNKSGFEYIITIK